MVIGDLGGTNCRIELVSYDAALNVPSTTKPRPEAIHKVKYKSNSAGSLIELLRRFLKEPICASALQTEPIVLFSIAVCGPVTDGRAILLAPCFGEEGWKLDVLEIKAALGSDVFILNDFHAVGLGLPHIPDSDKHTIYDAGGRQDPHGVLACLGPGTGLGEVYAVPCAEGYIVCCSEGGMSDFVPRNEDEWALRQWIAQRSIGGFVEVEKVVSGEGIANAYQWLRESRPALVTNTALDNEIMEATEAAGVIGQHCVPGTDEADPLCIQAVNLFLDALGAEASNLALRYQAKGGVFIAGGGIAGKLLSRVLDGRVAQAYVAKGHSLACYDTCPLFVAATPGDELGLSGAWEWGLRMYLSSDNG